MMKQDPASCPAAGRTRGLLVASQLALSLILLVGAGLLGRAFLELRKVPLGFNPANVMTMHLELGLNQRRGVAQSADTRFALFVLGAFAVLAVLLTAIGVYGVVAYATARRTREIAVRLALGADARRIVVLVLREGAGWTVAGLVAGVAGARLLTRYVQTLLFHVTPNDTLTFAGVAALLALVALVATALPAICAVRVDPMLALRSE